MYQSVSYNKFKGVVNVRDDERGWFEVPFNPTYYKIDDDGEFKDLFGRKCKKVYSYNDNDKDILEKDVDEKLVVLTNLYGDSDDAPKFQNILFFDIEIEIGGQLTKEYIEQAPMPLTSIAVYDATKKERIVLIIDKKETLENFNKDGVRVVTFKTEKKLLEYFLMIWKAIDPTIVVGWNSDYFDVPYVYYRLKKVFDKKTANSLSPLGYVREQPWSDKQPISISGVSSLDYMRMYKKFIPKTQPSYKLDYIGKKEVGLGKIKFDGNLDKLFREDIGKYVDYNMNDVEILIKLDEKLSFIELSVQICHFAHTSYENIYYSSIVLDGVIYTWLKRKEIISPNKPVTNNPSLKRSDEDDEKDDEKFKGAIVKDPQIGLHDWLTDEDLKALYPSNIRSVNIGLETIIGRVVDVRLQELEGLGVDYLNLLHLEKDFEEVYIEKINGDRTKVNTNKLVQLIKKNNYTISGNGIIFRTDKVSIIAEVLAEWSDKRDWYKDLMKQERKNGNFDKAKFYDIFQSVFKVFSNSIYGCLALASFRYTDEKKWLSTATTLTGQVITKSSIIFTNEMLSEELGYEDDFVVASDTDSMYIKCFPIVQKRLGNIDVNDDERIIPVVRQIAEELKVKINSYYDILAKEAFNIQGVHQFLIKPEYIIKKAYWSDKKKYACYLVEKEGTPIKKGEEFDFKGLDLMKSNFPIKFREFSEKMIIDILLGATKEQIDKNVLDFKKYTETAPFKEISLPSGLRTFNNKIAQKAPNGKIFSTLSKGATSHVKAACYYNDLLKFKGLDKKYQQLQEGDSVHYSYLKENPYNIAVLGCNGYDDPPEILEFIEKFMDREHNFNSIILKKIQKVYDNLKWGSPNFNENVNEFLKYFK
jgi:DNA polymerase elongation subunit (family B)